MTNQDKIKNTPLPAGFKFEEDYHYDNRPKLVLVKNTAKRRFELGYYLFNYDGDVVSNLFHTKHLKISLPITDIIDRALAK